MNEDVLEDFTRDIANKMAEIYDKAFKSGFYTGQGMAGVELEQCHKNWKKLNNHETE